jgi:hypothetical protein
MMKCEICGELPTHKNYLADLRNKYGRLNTYFQLKASCEKPDASEGVKRMFAKVEQSVIEDNNRFVALLKTRPDVWEKESYEQVQDV